MPFIGGMHSLDNYKHIVLSSSSSDQGTQRATVCKLCGLLILVKFGMSLILWSQILLRNSSENFRSDILHPNLVLKSDNETSDHFLSGI